jgi:hypothetical protein
MGWPIQQLTSMESLQQSKVFSLIDINKTILTNINIWQLTSQLEELLKKSQTLSNL